MLFNRDISWLGFNDRVLQEAADTKVPLIERIRFLAIFSSNLDEFSRVRYPVVLALSDLKNKAKKKIVPEPDEYLARQVQNIISEQLHRFGAIFNNDILPALEQAGTVLYYDRPILEQHKQELKDIFLSMVLSFIQPVYQPLKEELARYVECQWQDADKAGELQPNGEYQPVKNPTGEKINAQRSIYGFLKRKT